LFVTGIHDGEPDESVHKAKEQGAVNSVAQYIE